MVEVGMGHGTGVFALDLCRMNQDGD